jgi:hypothetical protein
MELEFQYYYFTEHLLISTIIIQTGWIKSLSKNGFQVELIFVVIMVKVTKAMIQIFTARQT